MYKILCLCLLLVPRLLFAGVSDITPEYPFNITTIDMPPGTVFNASIGANGTFYIDWGDGTDVQKIEWNNWYSTNISHTFKDGGTYIIRFGGVTTKHTNYSAISFSENTNIEFIHGSLGKIFPTLPDGQVPKFDHTFYMCSNLKEIPAELFSGVTGSTDAMFNSTFWGCSSLTKIPQGLFSGISGGAPNMFFSTFRACSKIQGPLPPDLFSGTSISESDTRMFALTFAWCMSLTGYITAGMFPDNAANVSDAFASTFNIVKSLDKTCPPNMYNAPPIGTVGVNSWDDIAVCRACPDGTVAPAASDNADACKSCTGNYKPNFDIGLCQITCDAGYYLAVANDAECSPVGAGFWTPASTINYGNAGTRNQCPDNLTTVGFGAGANSESDCGKVLRFGNHALYLHIGKETSPSLAIQHGERVLYGNMTTEKRGHLRTEYKGAVYSIY